MIYVRKYDHIQWDCITIEEYNQAEEFAGPVSAFAETRLTPPH